MDATRTYRPAAAVLAGAVAAALGIAGCTSGGSAGAAGSPSPSGPVTTSAPAPTAGSTAPTATSSPPAAPAPSPTCFDTDMVGDTTVAGYLARLPGATRIVEPGVFMDLDGLHLDTTPDRRPCGPVTVRITRFTVRLSHTGSGTVTRPSYSYSPLDTTEVTVGPANGTAPGSAPPATSHCSGVLSVVQLGAPVKDTELPQRLDLVTPSPAPTAPYHQNVKVTGERQVAAGLALPADAATC
ncbi:hypothetical protein [Kitasatospora purpeofusca]|uniref:hypothetical protein n=1 Tax=Kitasatospora purpeofusca TaxID=67352 RepID=UPI002A5AB81C|nr:hypothetical protein [Kitasatospora purpeofusca]MDY0815858.1 hypothetical protein [Kitasatospora purpeofusca]